LSSGNPEFTQEGLHYSPILFKSLGPSSQGIIIARGIGNQRQTYTGGQPLDLYFTGNTDKERYFVEMSKFILAQSLELQNKHWDTERPYASASRSRGDWTICTGLGHNRGVTLLADVFGSITGMVCRTTRPGERNTQSILLRTVDRRIE
jgi:hypothetical protein